MINYIIGILMVLLGIVCLMLIGLVLIQKTKGQGAISFGGGAEAVFGAQMGNVLTRATVVFGILFLVIVTALSVVKPRGGRTSSFADRVEAGNTPQTAQPMMGFEDFDYSQQPMAQPIEFDGGTITIPARPEDAPPANNGDQTVIEKVEVESAPVVSEEPTP